MSKIVAEPVRAADLLPGDLFCPDHGPEYWWVFPNFLCVGMGVFLATAAPCPPEDEEVIVYRLRLQRDLDLLAALEGVVETMRQCQVQYPPTTFVYDQLESILQQAQAAITQAKGEAS